MNRDSRISPLRSDGDRVVIGKYGSALRYKAAEIASKQIGQGLPVPRSQTLRYEAAEHALKPAVKTGGMMLITPLRYEAAENAVKTR